MNIIINIIIPVIATFIFSFLLALYFFRKSISRKMLTPFVTKYIKVFSNINDSLRKELKIKYKEKIINNFHSIQFTIANTGNTAVKDFKKPLTLCVPKKAILLDTKILCVYPSGRKVDFKIQNVENQYFIEFDFYLLNKNEFFIFEIYIGGEVEINEFYFRIETDGLPPILHLVQSTNYSTKRRQRRITFIISSIIYITVAIFVIIYSLLRIFSIIEIKQITEPVNPFKSYYSLLYTGIIPGTTILIFLIIFLIFDRKERKLDVKSCINIPKNIINEYFSDS